MDRPMSKAAQLMVLAESVAPGILDRLIPQTKYAEKTEADLEQDAKNLQAAEAKRLRKNSRRRK